MQYNLLKWIENFMIACLLSTISHNKFLHCNIDFLLYFRTLLWCIYERISKVFTFKAKEKVENDRDNPKTTKTFLH